MKIGIDYRFAATTSGLGRYTRELVSHLLKQNDGIEYILFDDSDFKHYSLSEQILLPRIIKKSKIDLLFSPHFNVPLRCPVPFVVTIHDLILHDHPDKAPLWKRCAYRLQMRYAITKASHIIAVSQWTATDIKKRYGDRKISVIHEGISSLFSPRSHDEQKRVCQIYHIESPFFLYVGSTKPHKNIETIKNAAKQANVRLVCVPQSTGYVPDTDLPALYSAATAFVTASLAEGFCLPALEAFACGCPVIASALSAIPEVTNGHARLIDPTVEEFTKSMQYPPPRPPPIRLYYWEETAKKTATILRKTCEPLHPSLHSAQC